MSGWTRSGRWRCTAAAAVLAAVPVAACGDSSPSAVTVVATTAVSPTVTTSASSIVSTTTAAVPASTSVPGSTSTAIGPASTVADFEPACQPMVATSAPAVGTASDASTLDRFGPLGAYPAVIAGLPTVPSSALSGPTASGRTAPAVRTVRVAGGVLVSVSAGSSSDLARAIVAVVDLDGTTRWVRCLDAPLGAEIWAAPQTSGATTALVALMQSMPRGQVSTVHLVVSLLTGETLGASAAGDGPVWPELASLGDHWVLAQSAGEVLFGHAPECCGANNVDSLVRYDLATNELRALVVPDEVRGDSFVSLDYDERGDPEVLDGLVVRAVFRDGSWRRAAATIRAAVPNRVGFAYGEGPAVLQGVDATGRQLWSDDRFTAPALEGTGLWPDGDLTVGQVCTELDAVTGCAAYALVGLVTDTGAVAWTRPGMRQVEAVGDGYVLATDGPMFEPAAVDTPPTPGWELLDARTGARVAPDQHWADPTTFQAECCGGGETVWVGRFGAVVVNVVRTELRIWLPRDLTPAQPVRTSLP